MGYLAGMIDIKTMMEPKMLEQSVNARRVLWIGLLAAATVGSSLVFACAAPFAALIAVAATNMGRRDALTLTGLVWLSNQLVGYLVLDYPQDVYSFAWGAALGVASLAAVLAATQIATRVKSSIALPKAIIIFATAFAVFQLTLIAASYILPTGEEAFSLVTLLDILEINVVALAGLTLLYRLGVVLGLGLPVRQKVVIA